MNEHPAVVPSSRRGKPPVSRKGGRTRLPARVSGRHVARGRESSPNAAQASRFWWQYEVRQVTGKVSENGQNSGAGRQLTLDKTVGSRVW